jgi:hypothetical protein
MVNDVMEKVMLHTVFEKKIGTLKIDVAEGSTYMCKGTQVVVESGCDFHKNCMVVVRGMAGVVRLNFIDTDIDRLV